MFLFIGLRYKTINGNGIFKYISCSYLSFFNLKNVVVRYSFKYISCSYLSNTLSHNNADFLYLNTSHVLIYLQMHRTHSAGFGFKYISCSYLSRKSSKHDCKSCGFKYISCSYLSIHPHPLLLHFQNLNTSHVLIYPCNFFAFFTSCFDLNTSHVLIYRTHIAIPCFAYFYLNTSHVLIYRSYARWISRWIPFKYISCSYLSKAVEYGFATSI